MSTNLCTLNTNPTLPNSSEKEVDEYAVINSEDENNKDKLPIEDEDEDDALSEHLIRAFSSSHDVELQEKNNRKSSPTEKSKGYHLEGFIKEKIIIENN